MEDKEYYTVKEVADLLGVKKMTVYRWIREGVMDVTQKVRKGAIRIHRLEIATYKREEVK